MNPQARVTRDIADLVPQFLRSREIELESLGAALATHDEARLVELGQRMRAVGEPYGFPQITALGRQIIEAGVDRDFDSISRLIAQYKAYLGEVEVVHVDVPAPAWQAVALAIQDVSPPA